MCLLTTTGMVVKSVPTWTSTVYTTPPSSSMSTLVSVTTGTCAYDVDEADDVPPLGLLIVPEPLPSGIDAVTNSVEVDPVL
jgi:hypothetical protein